MGDVTPYLCVDGAQRAIEWYVEHLGGEVTMGPFVMEDGRVGHVELAFGGSGVMMSDVYPAFGVQEPDPGRGAAVSLHIEVDDVAARAQAAVAGGARLDRGPEVTEHGTVAVLRDPFGHRWFLNQPL